MWLVTFLLLLESLHKGEPAPHRTAPHSTGVPGVRRVGKGWGSDPEVHQFGSGTGGLGEHPGSTQV